MLDELRAAGVWVFDATPSQLNERDTPRFLQQDTHWTPAWMAEVARSLADAISQRHVLTPVVGTPGWKVAARTVTRVGDIVDMLKLPEGQALFPAREVSVQQVQHPDGTLWEARESSDVLLLGDSFTNIFTFSAMGWGEAAGFAPHLALALGREVDVLAQNDSGAYATRKLLAEALGAGEDRLAGKKLVIWEFASRELAVGDWKPLPLPAAGK